MQLASNVIEDGLGLELIDAFGEVVADVFRSDRNRSVELKVWSTSVPDEEVVALAQAALERLDPFEDGTPLTQATGHSDLVNVARQRPNYSLERTRER